MTTALESAAATPLTALSEEEQMFQQSVRDFAIEKIRPLVPQMDHDAVMDKSLISSFFELGIMGIEVPDQWGRRRLVVLQRGAGGRGAVARRRLLRRAR